MHHPYVISLDGGKYTITVEHGQPLRFMRHGDPWPAAQESLAYSNVVSAMAWRIQELETAVSKVLHGTFEPNGDRAPDGLSSFPNAGSWPPLYMWAEILRGVLGQKS
jgi:hypothetical protein